ncbi:MAG: hypothetical protein JNM39_04355 [Bdellovibrionaceae bacterium]|nr:hypothetical protein [Pseudobdellovibrionaceae bacterium]
MEKFISLLVILIAANLNSAFGGESSRALSAPKSQLYNCKCVKTTDKSPPSGQSCNFPGFSITISPEKAVISGYFSGKPSSSAKGKSRSVEYVGFEGFDFHYQITLELELKTGLESPQIKLHATGEKDFVETLKCKANRDKVRH